MGCTVLSSLPTSIPNVSCKSSLFSMQEYAVARVFARCNRKAHTLQCLASCCLWQACSSSILCVFHLSILPQNKSPFTSGKKNVPTSTCQVQEVWSLAGPLRCKRLQGKLPGSRSTTQQRATHAQAVQIPLRCRMRSCNGTV